MQTFEPNRCRMTRRDMLQLSLASLALWASPTLWGDEGAGDAAIAAIVGKRPVSSEGIRLSTPAIAENGNTVPIGVEVDGSFTPDKYVKTLHVLALDNPTPDVITFQFSPASGKAKVSTRIRLAKTQRVVAIAEWSDGRVLQAMNEVKVTIGGCGG